MRLFTPFFPFQNELKDVEEKFRKAMVANAGLDNDKAELTYQVRNHDLCVRNLDLKVYCLNGIKI